MADFYHCLESASNPVDIPLAGISWICHVQNAISRIMAIETGPTSSPPVQRLPARLSWLGIFFLLMVVGLGYADSEQSNLVWNLDNIIIPEVNFRGAKPSDMVAFLSNESRRLDPEHVGVNIILQGEIDETGAATLSLRNVPLVDAVKYVCSLAGLIYRIGTNAVIISKGAVPTSSKSIADNNEDIRFSGQITNTLPNGTMYIGEMKDGKPNGLGKGFAVGGQYVGDWKDGKPDGHGQFKWGGGGYVGGVKDGKLDGQGEITRLNGFKYVGGFKGGRMDGQGTGTWPNGHQYVGEWKDDKRNGQGTLTSREGSNQRGEWRNGEQYRLSGTWIADDGTKEVGTWNYDGTTSGGTIIWKDGRRYEGDWEIVDGSVDLPDGHGKMTYPDGKVEYGVWKDGKFIGASRTP